MARKYLETHIAEFERNHPGWTWLLRDGRGTVAQAGKYFCHLLAPTYMEEVRRVGARHVNPNLHSVGWGETPLSAFVNAVNIMEATS